MKVFSFSLPFIFSKVSKGIPNEVPYISVPVKAGERALPVINRNGTSMRIGIAWNGGTIDSPIATIRSIKMEFIDELCLSIDATFFTLPRWKADLDVSGFSCENIVDLESYLDLNNLAETAAAVQAMDLIISVDSTLVHLAGALGKPVWTLLPYSPDWRWMLNREDSPWYPTMRLFRQPKPGDWASVITRVKAELTALVHKQKRDRYISAKM